MVNIAKLGDSAIKFTFTDNYRYLHNGEIEVPLNSLILVVDESDMVTFKKIDGDPFVSFLISDSNFESKETLIYFYKTSMVGSTGGGSESGITSGDVESMIEASLEDYYDIDEIDAALSGKADTSSVYTKSEVDTALSNKQNTLIAGSGITISGNVISAEGGNNVIELTQAEYDALVTGGTVDPSVFYIITDATEINISDYYTSAQTQSAINAAVSGKQDVSGMTAYTTSSDVESYVSGFTYDKATIDSKVASGGTFDPTNYYDKTATDALLDDKFDASAFTSYSAATDARLAEDEEVTAAALNALNEELSGKQDTLVAGSGITISGNVISAQGGGSITIDPSLDSGSTNAVANSAITTAINLMETKSDIPFSAHSYTQDASKLWVWKGAAGELQPNITNGVWYDVIIGNGNNFSGDSDSYLSGKMHGLIVGKYNTVQHVRNHFIFGHHNIAQHRNYNAHQALLGRYLNSKNEIEVAIGGSNISLSGSTTFGDSGNTLFSVGNGASTNARHNAFDIRQNGDIYIADTNDTSTSNYYEKPMIKLQDALGGGSITIDPSLDSGSTNAVANSAITSQFNSIDARMSEDEEVTAAALNALNDKFDGLRLKKLTQAEYEALTVKDNNTLYILVG